MTMLDRMAETAESRPPADRRFRVWGWIFAGCGAMLAVIAAVGLLFTWLLGHGRAELTPIVESYLDRVEQRAYDQAYRSLGDRWKAASTYEEFLDFAMLMDDALGAHRSVRLTTVNHVKNLGSPEQAVAVFDGRFEHASATMRVTFEKYDDGWRIEGIHYDSPAIAAKLTCPHCGAKNTIDARHCSHCGAKIDRPSDRLRNRQRDAT